MSAYGFYTVTVRVPQLICFGCQRVFAIGVNLFNPAECPLELHLVRINAVCDRPSYALGIADEADLFERADRMGWRKLTLYGQTIYLCPECRRNRKRPEWEQHLTEEAAATPPASPRDQSSNAPKYPELTKRELVNLRNGICPDCKEPGKWLKGPEAGCSTNWKCGECGSRFNIADPFFPAGIAKGFCQRISEPRPGV